SSSNGNRVFDFRSSTITGLRIEGNTITNAKTYSAPLLDLDSTGLTDARIAGNTVTGLNLSVPGYAPFLNVDGAGPVRNLTITGNTFTGVSGDDDEYSPVIRLHPNAALQGVNTVDHNTFTASCGVPTGVAIAIDGAVATTISTLPDGHLAVT